MKQTRGFTRYIGFLTTAVIVCLLTTGCSQRIIDKPVFIVGGTVNHAGLTCNKEFEAVPSSVTNAQGDVEWFAGLGFGRMTFAKGDWSNWTGGPTASSLGFDVAETATGPGGLTMLTGDAWTTYSERKNLAFFSFIGRPPPEGGSSCVAVAATTPEKLETQDWDFPATCISPSNGDQCAILHIDQSNTFYAACSFSDNGPSIRIQAFDNCITAPGVANGCPRTAVTDIRGVNQLQFSIAENPCTGNLVMTYRKGQDIRVRFYDENLTELGDSKVRGGQSFSVGQTNTGCTRGTIRRCGMGSADCCNSKTKDCQTDTEGMCLRDNGRPSIDTYLTSSGGSQTCGAVIAYDSLVKGEDGNLWSKSRLDIVDITSETSPVVKAQWKSTSDQYAWNQYLSYAVVSDKGPNARRPKIGWFWLTDIRGACNVIAEGATSINLGSTVQATGIISGPFPGVVTDSFGIGDYIRGIKGGDDDGSLYVSWGEPVTTSAAECSSCMGDTWNLATKISRIRWVSTGKPGPETVVSPAPVVEGTFVDD